ncbi:TPA: hypothetical protein QDB14_004103, partial [Burkholderia vietnamiensis]|nr:hypothetical protein [Burkholderia vietnamiensis]
MSYDNLSDAVNGFKADADRVDAFVNGAAGTSYTTTGGQQVPSLQTVVAQIEAENVIAQTQASVAAAATSASAAAASATQSAAAAHAYASTAAALADAGLAIGASFSAPLGDGSLQTYTKTSGTVATPVGLPFLSTGSPVSANVLFDAFNEFSYANPLLGAWNWYAAGIPTFTLASANLPLTTPVAQATGAAAIFKYWDPTQAGIKVGDAIRVAVYAWFQNTGGRATLYFRDSSGNVLGTTSVGIAAGAGINTILLTGTVPASTYSISVRVDSPTSGGAFEWGATFASIGVANPAYVRAPAPRLYLESDTTGPNMLFDSFNEYSSIDPLFAEWQWWSTVPTFTSASANIPLSTPVAQGSGTTNVDKKYKFGPTRLKAGDKATFAVLCWFAAAGGTISVFFRDASNNVLASMVVANRPSGLQTAYVPITVPAGAVDNVLIRVVQTVAASAFEVGGYFAAVDQRPALVRSVPAKSYLEATLTGPNILFDAYNEFSSGNVRFGGWASWWPATPPTFTTSSANIPLTTPVVIGTPGQSIDKTYDFSVLGLKAGDSVTVGVLTYFANAGASISVSYRDSGGTVLQNTAGLTLSAGLQMAYLTSVVPSGAVARLAIRVTPPATGAFEVGGYFAAIGQKPNRNSAPCPAKYNSLVRRQRNMMPDPFLRLANDGVLVDGHVVSDVAATSIVKTSNSPFRAKLALFIPSGSGSVNRNVAVKRLHLKAGDTLLTKLGMYGNQSVAVGVFLRGADGTVYSNNSSTVTLANSYGEVIVATAITQTMVDNADYLQIRTLSGQTAGASGVYVCGYGAFVGTEDVALSDDAFDLDDSQIGQQRSKHYRAGEQYVREARMRLTKLDLAVSAQLVVGAIGDSWTHNADRWSGVFANWIVGKYGDAGGGFTGFGSGGGVYDNGNARYALYGYSRSGTWDASVYTASVTAGIGQITSSTAGSKVTCTVPAGPVLSAANLQWVATADGVIQYRWNGGAWTNV